MCPSREETPLLPSDLLTNTCYQFFLYAIPIICFLHYCKNLRPITHSVLRATMCLSGHALGLGRQQVNGSQFLAPNTLFLVQLPAMVIPRKKSPLISY